MLELVIKERRSGEGGQAFDFTTTVERGEEETRRRRSGRRRKLSAFNWLNEGGMGRRGCWEAGFDFYKCAFVELNAKAHMCKLPENMLQKTDRRLRLTYVTLSINVP